MSDSGASLSILSVSRFPIDRACQKTSISTLIQRIEQWVSLPAGELWDVAFARVRPWPECVVRQCLCGSSQQRAREQHNTHIENRHCASVQMSNDMRRKGKVRERIDALYLSFSHSLMRPAVAWHGYLFVHPSTWWIRGGS